jgi:hypothetical protein
MCSKIIPDFDEDPHLRQVGENFPVNVYASPERVLHIKSAPRLPYKRVAERDRSTCHWGQRKLLLSEIEFLTLCTGGGGIVIYAGGAPGQVGKQTLFVFESFFLLLTILWRVLLNLLIHLFQHIRLLSELFPRVSRFVLFDPRPFALVPCERVQLRQEMFTDQVCDEFKTNKEPVLFISDIRTANPNEQVRKFFHVVFLSYSSDCTVS